MRAAKLSALLILALSSCPAYREPSIHFAGSGLTCSDAAGVEGMTCTEVCDLGYGECTPDCLGQDVEAIFFATRDACVHASEPGESLTYTCDDPIEADSKLPFVGCCC
jgi:hypothetical protein